MKTKPLIGITAFEMPHPEPPHSVYYALGQRYARAIEETGGAPVVLPPGLGQGSLERIFDKLDGLLLSGGGDVEPSFYQEPSQAALVSVSLNRDRDELALARWAMEKNKPLLCICRGIQVLNVALGGSLIQDIPTQVPGALEHSFDNKVVPHDHLAHPVSLEPASRLAQVMGVNVSTVNSWHHQAIKQVAKGLAVVAHAPDGIIEAVELAGHPFAIGVQWHPEWLYDKQDEQRRLFAALVQAAAG